MKKFLPLSLICLAIFYSKGADAQGFAITARLGSMGYGLELVKSISPTLNTRLGGNFFKLGFTGVEGDELKYEFDLKMSAGLLLVDWYPVSWGLKITTGAVYNKNRIDINLKSAKSYTITNTVYTPDELGNVDGKVEFNPFAPYFGIGFGNPLGRGQRLRFNLDLGFVFQNSPTVTLDATGLIRPTAEQEALIEDNLKWAKWFPNISLGISLKI